MIDTPGFGDTRGIEYDGRIDTMIKTTFKRLKTLYYVCLVSKSTDNRLLGSTKYVCETIQNLFGKDLSDRVLLMNTFSDGKEVSKKPLEALNF